MNQARSVEARGTIAGASLLREYGILIYEDVVLSYVCGFFLSAPGALWLGNGDAFVLGTTSFANNTARLDGGE